MSKLVEPVKIRDHQMRDHVKYRAMAAAAANFLLER